MLQYLLWRVMVGLHHSITLFFVIVGHMKFSPDWCFRLLRQRFRRTKVGCLDDLVKVVDSSAGVNIAQLVGTQERGENRHHIQLGSLLCPEVPEAQEHQALPVLTLRCRYTRHRSHQQSCRRQRGGLLTFGQL